MYDEPMIATRRGKLVICYLFFYCSPTWMALHVVHNQLLKQGQSSLVYPAIFTIMNPYEPGFHRWISNHYVTAVMFNNNYYNNQIHRKYGSVCHLYLITATIILTTVIIGGFSGDQYSPETPDHQSDGLRSGATLSGVGQHSPGSPGASR